MTTIKRYESFRFGVTSSKRKPDETGETSVLTDETQPKKDRISSKTRNMIGKIKRYFLPLLKVYPPWLNFDETTGLMECTFCVKYPTHSERGSALFRGTKNY